MAHISRFKKRASDRSGFYYYELGMVKQGPWKVGADEYDIPPPSKTPLGGEGDIAQGEQRPNSDFSSISTTDTPSGSDNPVVFITAAGGITPGTHPFMRIAGSNQAIDVTANPQIVRGIQSQQLALLCVGSSITLDNGTGLALMGSSRFIMNSGDVITFIYDTGNSVWWETSRQRGGGI